MKLIQTLNIKEPMLLIPEPMLLTPEQEIDIIKSLKEEDFLGNGSNRAVYSFSYFQSNW